MTSCAGPANAICTAGWLSVINTLYYVAMKHPMIITIDGPAGSGKSTIAKRLALSLGITLLDTGAIYRAVALLAARDGVRWDDEARLASLAMNLPLEFKLEGERNHVKLAGDDVTDAIRTPEISAGASAVSALAGVRTALLQLQRQFGSLADLVAEGRDMGTVVFPGAQVKIFMDAAPEVRAARRRRELLAAGHSLSQEQVESEQAARDEADSTRQVAPLRPAEDAIIMDTSSLGIEEVVDKICELIKERCD